MKPETFAKSRRSPQEELVVNNAKNFRDLFAHYTMSAEDLATFILKLQPAELYEIFELPNNATPHQIHAKLATIREIKTSIFNHLKNRRLHKQTDPYTQMYYDDVEKHVKDAKQRIADFSSQLEQRAKAR
jgi:hypothetical protein